MKKREKQKLTKRLIHGLKPLKTGRLRIFDSELTGFGVVVYPTGRKTFVLRYGDRRHRRWMILGDHGLLTVDAARTMAHLKLADHYKGQDPLDERQRRRDSPLFREWTEDYLRRVSMRKKSPIEDRKYLKVASGAFGTKPLDEVAMQDIEQVFERYASQGKPTAANRFLASVRACLQDAWRHGHIGENPGRKIRHLPEVPARNRVLTEDELSRFQAAIEKLPDPFARAAFVMMVTTGARRKETLTTRWEDLDLRNGIWRIPRPKAGEPLAKPLPRYTIEILDRLRPLALRSTHVFPGRDPQHPRADLKRQWHLIRRETGLLGLRVTDIRRTFGNDMALGAGLLMASHLMGHTSPETTARHYVPGDWKQQKELVEKRTNEKIVPISKVR